MIHAEILRGLWQEFSSQFNRAYETSEDLNVEAFVTSMSLSTETMRFDFLKSDHQFEKWKGQRTFKQLDNAKYVVGYEEWHWGLKVLRRDIINATVGPLSLQAFNGGKEAAKLKPRICTDALQNGGDSTSLCYDGQPFFDTEHPVGEDGDISLVSNYYDGGGASAASPWYLMDLSRGIKPIIHLEREAVRFYSFTNLTDPNVFFNKEFLFAADASMGTGYGLWQTCFRSEATPTVNKIRALDFAMRDLRGDIKDENGRRPKLGIKPTHIVYGATQRDRIKMLINSPQLAGNWDSDVLSFGASDTLKPNPLYNQYTLQEVSWLP